MTAQEAHKIPSTHETNLHIYMEQFTHRKAQKLGMVRN